VKVVGNLMKLVGNFKKVVWYFFKIVRIFSTLMVIFCVVEVIWEIFKNVYFLRKTISSNLSKLSVAPCRTKSVKVKADEALEASMLRPNEIAKSTSEKLNLCSTENSNFMAVSRRWGLITARKEIGPWQDF
jgi:hypothetical protein